jgi:hypothetical protein
MGFMDKAKKLAEQAQEKLDDAQKNFNKGQGGSEGQPGQGGVQYDEHGRPIQQETPAAATPPPTATPEPAAPGAPAPTEGATGGPAPTPEEEPAPPPPPQQSQGGGSSNPSPDPFKPLDQ